MNFFPQDNGASYWFFPRKPMRASCLMDFHQEAVFSQFSTLLAKKELRSRLQNLFTLFLKFLKKSGSLNIACCRCWIRIFNSSVIQGLSVGCRLIFRNGKKGMNSIT